MTEPHPARPSDEPPAGLAGPAAGGGAGHGPARRLRYGFEQGLGLAQLTVLLPVVMLVLSGIGAFIYGAAVAVYSVIEIAQHPSPAVKTSGCSSPRSIRS
jgi:hypothetical protein